MLLRESRATFDVTTTYLKSSLQDLTNHFAHSGESQQPFCVGFTTRFTHIADYTAHTIVVLMSDQTRYSPISRAPWTNQSLAVWNGRMQLQPAFAMREPPSHQLADPSVFAQESDRSSSSSSPRPRLRPAANLSHVISIERSQSSLRRLHLVGRSCRKAESRCFEWS